MTYGYEPQDDPQAGSWREVWAIMRAVFAVLGPPLAIFLGAITLLMLTMFLLLANPILALIPVGLIVFGAWLLIRRDKRIQDERERAIKEGRPDPYA
jgi:hypothetical protein